jgi:hypothetical protein
VSDEPSDAQKWQIITISRKSMAKKDIRMRSPFSLKMIVGVLGVSLLLWEGVSLGGESIGTESVEGLQTDIIIGEIIVKFDRTTTIAEGVSKLQEVFKENSLAKVSEIAVINAVVLRTDIYELYKDGTIDKDEAQQRTLDLLQKIQGFSFVEDAELNEEVIERFPFSIESV